MADAPQERVVVGGDDELDGWRQAVERDVGVDLLEIPTEVTQRVDREDPHRQFRNILHRQIEGHRVAGPEDGGIRGEKLDLDPVAQGPVSRRAEDRRMALLLAEAACQLRLGKQPGEIVPFDKWDKLARVGRVDEEVGQQRADKRLVVADWRQERTFKRHPEIAGEGTGGVARQELGRHVALRPRQLQIVEECSLVPHPLRQVVHEEVVANVGLEGVVNRPEPNCKSLQALEVGALHARVAAPIVVGARLELLQHRRHEGGMVDELGLEDAKRVELGDGEEPMDRQRPEAAGVWRIEIGGDQLREAVVIGADKPGKELTATERIERRGACGTSGQPIEGALLEAIERAGGLGLGAGGKRLGRDELPIERRRQLRLGAGDDPLVRIRDTEPALEIGYRALRIFCIVEQRPPRADLPHPRRLAVGLDPLGQERLDLGIPLGIQKMERVKIERFLRPRNEPGEDRLTILRQRELLHEADLAGPAARTPESHGDAHDRQAYDKPPNAARFGRRAQEKRLLMP